MITLRSKTRYQAMQWQPTQEVYNEFLKWQPATPMVWKPEQDSLRVAIGDGQTAIFVYPGQWLVCIVGTGSWFVVSDEALWKHYEETDHESNIS